LEFQELEKVVEGQKELLELLGVSLVAAFEGSCFSFCLKIIKFSVPT
jgi:hypothetical protein